MVCVLARSLVCLILTGSSLAVSLMTSYTNILGILMEVQTFIQLTGPTTGTGSGNFNIHSFHGQQLTQKMNH